MQRSKIKRWIIVFRCLIVQNSVAREFIVFPLSFIGDVLVGVVESTSSLHFIHNPLTGIFSTLCIVKHAISMSHFVKFVTLVDPSCHLLSEMVRFSLLKAKWIWVICYFIKILDFGLSAISKKQVLWLLLQSVECWCRIQIVLLPCYFIAEIRWFFVRNDSALMLSRNMNTVDNILLIYVLHFDG